MRNPKIFCTFAVKLYWIIMAETEELQQTASYNDDNIIHLDDREHIRRRPGMYIGKLGDGRQEDDGIYVLIKETVDNSIDEFRMKEWLWSVNGKVGVSYPIIRFVSAFGEVSANYYFDNGSTIETIHSEKPFTIGFNMGFRLGF